MNNGKDFEKDVKNLLKLQGWTVSDEILVRSKKVDSLISKVGDFGETKTYALECKDYLNKLTKEQTVNIYADYLPLLENKLIEGIILITKNGISPAANEYVNTLFQLRHLTYSELLNIVVGFDKYVDGLIQEYDTDGLDQYYVKQNYSSYKGSKKEDYLEDKIISWVYDENDFNPIAILASYGMGKTTLSKRVSYILSMHHLSNPTNRIPVLIKLEEFINEQSLEGLLGKHFTSFANVPNYNFRSFNKLNSLGRFVIILDGFDEMKNNVSFDTLKYNFSQLNRLVCPNSKVILLGRPTVLLSDNEHREIFQGERKLGTNISKIPNSPNFTEYEILSFNEQQIAEFITKYFKFCNKKSIGKIDLTIDPKNKFLSSIIARPVLLKMLIELLPYYNSGKFDILTTTLLYSDFIDLVIRREQEKLSRNNYESWERREFAKNLAYWMWTENLYEITFEEIPNNLIIKYLKNTNDRNITDIKRDFLNACFLERKHSSGFSFPHKSFQEFLVAEKIYEMVTHNYDDILNLDHMTPEIFDFICELLTEREVLNWRKDIFERGDLAEYTKSFIKFFVDICKFFEIVITKQEVNVLTRRSPDWSVIKSTNKPSKKVHRLGGVTPKKKYKQK